MANPAGESKDEILKLDFDRRLMQQFRGSVVTSMPDPQRDVAMLASAAREARRDPSGNLDRGASAPNRRWK
jgi:hypothetical protein